MAQDTLTVTPPNPTPPTNMSCTGASGPNPLNYDPLVYADPKNWGVGTPSNPPPYFDDGITRTLTSGGINENVPASGVSASPQAIAVKTAALAVGGTSVDGEGRGTETVVTATVPNPSPAGQLKQVSVLGNFTSTPNASHASTMSPATNPALVSISPTTLAAAATGTQLITCTGTGFVPGCRIWHDNVEQTTTWVSATSMTALVKKRPFAGVVPVVVKLAGAQMGAAPNFTWT